MIAIGVIVITLVIADPIMTTNIEMIMARNVENATPRFIWLGDTAKSDIEAARNVLNGIAVVAIILKTVTEAPSGIPGRKPVTYSKASVKVTNGIQFISNVASYKISPKISMFKGNICINGLMCIIYWRNFRCSDEENDGHGKNNEPQELA